jgi:Caudovirus prohead serine protease
VRRLVTVEEFARLAPSEQEMAALTGMSPGAPEIGQSGRLVRYLFSTPDVGRDLHTVAANAWLIENFIKNPVFLWAHDDTQPPIGRVVQLAAVGDQLRGAVEYADADLNPFADMIYRMVKGGYINATSTSWLPLEWSPSRDKNRQGGVDFTKVDLLEISNVPIPAMPGALASARSNGIDTAPLYEWAERLLDKGDMTVVARGELEQLRRAAKMPAAAASRPSQTDIPIGENEVKERALKPKRAFIRSGADPLFKRGLYDAGRLCFLLEELGYAHFSAAFEAEMEGDGSALPAMLKDILDSLGKACIEMTAEEVGEFLAMHGPDDDEDDEDGESRALKPAARAFIAEAKNPRARALRRGIAIARAGKELSVGNQDHLEAAQDHHERALKHHTDLGEHSDSVGTHVDAAQAQCERTTQTLAELGEHVRAAAEDPAKSKDHLDAAAKAHGEAEKGMGAVAKAHEDAKDSHADADDAHRALGRRIKAARRCVRAVLSGAVTSEADETGADDVQKQQKASEEKARAARVAKATALQRKEPVTLTLD